MKKWINNIFHIFVYFIPVSVIIYLWIRRFKPKVVKEIFINISFEQALIYLLLFVVNLLLISLFICIYLQRRKEANPTTFGLFLSDISSYFRKSFKSTTILFFNIPYIDYPIAYMTQYLIKVPPHIIKYYSYFVHVLIITTLSIDILYLEKFKYTYYIIFPLFIELMIRGCLFIAVTFNEELNWELTRSIVLINIEKAITSPETLTAEDYALSEYNTQLKDIPHYFRLLNLMFFENMKLSYIEVALEKPMIFNLLRRLVFLCLWGYVLFYCPYPIINTLFILGYNYFHKHVPSIMLMAVFCLVPILLYKNKYKA